MNPEPWVAGVRSRRPGIIGPLLLTALLALAVGILFRYYSLTGVGFYRMFATMGIVFTGIAAVTVVHRLQLAEAYATLEGTLEECAETCSVWSARRPRRIAPLHLVLAPRVLLAVAAEEAGNRAKERRLLARSLAGVDRLRRAGEQWREDLAAGTQAAGAGEQPGETPRTADLVICPVVVWLRKALPQPDAVDSGGSWALEVHEGWVELIHRERESERLVVAQPEALPGLVAALAERPRP